MNRLQLVELEDLPWVPRVVRDGGTDLLDVLFGRMRFYRPLAPRLAALIQDTGERLLLDLGSGGGGGALAMWRELDALGTTGIQLELTDRFPNEDARHRVDAFGVAAVRYRTTALDAFAVPSREPGIRTMFSALHHFPPHEVERLLSSIVSARRPLAIFDIAASPGLRRLPTVFAPIAAIPNFVLLFVLALLLTPLVRPVPLSRLVLTYLVPLIPILFGWDGTVSALRAYAPAELETLVAKLPGGDGYEWSVTRQGSVLCLIGRPLPMRPTEAQGAAPREIQP